MLDFIIPCYHEAEGLRNCYDAIHKLCEEHDIPHRFCFVDDGSTDGTWEVIQSLPAVEGIKFSRNFGKEAAIHAGLCKVQGDCAIVIDADLQHPIELIPQMYKLWKEEGYAVINFVKKEEPNKSALHKGFSKLFNSLISRAVGIDMAKASDYKLLDRHMIDILKNLPEQQKFFRALVPWAGYKQCNLYWDTHKREIGQSKWNFFSLLRYALVNIASFSSAPLQIITFVGVIFSFLSAILGIQTLVRFLSGQSLQGFTTVILLQLITGSVLMLGIGVIGFYISMIYKEVKRRPLYLVEEEKERE